MHNDPDTKARHRLSKMAHWMSDEGRCSADDDLRIATHPTRFVGAGPEMPLLRTFAGRHLQLDPEAKLRPSIESRRRHRARFVSSLRH